MKETARISKLFSDLYDGSPWIEVNLTNTLNNIGVTTASKKISASSNSIWEIVNHIIDWRQNVLQRLNGKLIKSPAHNYFLPVKDQSEDAWKMTLKKLHVSQVNWIEFLQKFDEINFQKSYPGNDISYYDHIHGIIQHDAYHLGQIVMLSKASR